MRREVLFSFGEHHQIRQTSCRISLKNKNTVSREMVQSGSGYSWTVYFPGLFSGWRTLFLTFLSRAWQSVSKVVHWAAPQKDAVFKETTCPMGPRGMTLSSYIRIPWKGAALMSSKPDNCSSVKSWSWVQLCESGQITYLSLSFSLCKMRIMIENFL